MAEIITGKRAGKGPSRKGTPRVDMTPMVDLGFLLITFFMLATTLTQPKTMNLVMPRNDGAPMPLKAGKALTVLLGAGDRIAYYEGDGNDPAQPPLVRYTGYSNHNGIREVIQAKRRQVLQQYGTNDLMMLIKAGPGANYRNVVDIMDEMLINHVEKYALADLLPAEEAYIR